MFICTIESTQVSWAGHELRLGQKRNTYRVLAGKPQRNRPVGRPKLRERGNNKINFTVTEF